MDRAGRTRKRDLPRPPSPGAKAGRRWRGVSQPSRCSWRSLLESATRGGRRNRCACFDRRSSFRRACRSIDRSPRSSSRPMAACWLWPHRAPTESSRCTCDPSMARRCNLSPELTERRTPSGLRTGSRSRSSRTESSRGSEATGGAIQTICDAPQGRGGTWGPDGTIVFAPTLFGPLWRVSASGGSPIEAEAAIGAGESHRLPHFLPDGRNVLFLATGPSRPQEHGIYALDLATKKVRLVAHGYSEGRFVAPGYLAFVRERNLMVQRFDPDSLRLSGEAVPVAEKQRFKPLRRKRGVFLCRPGPSPVPGRGPSAAKPAHLVRSRGQAAFEGRRSRDVLLHLSGA